MGAQYCGIDIVGFGFAEGGYRQMINNVRAVQTPDNVADIKWRVMQDPVYEEFRPSIGDKIYICRQMGPDRTGSYSGRNLRWYSYTDRGLRSGRNLRPHHRPGHLSRYQHQRAF